MTCVSPPELEGAVLLAYLDGEDNSDVAAHLAVCEHCRQRAASLRSQSRMLTRSLYRFECPDPLELAEYRAGLLGAGQSRKIRKHVATCSACQEEVARLDQFMGEVALDPKEGLMDRVKVLVGRLVEGGLPQPGLALQPALSGARGSAAGALIFEAGKARIALEVAQDPEAPEDFSLYGLVSAVDAQGWQVQAATSEESLDGSPVDDLGNFVVSRLGPGEYTVVLMGEDMEIRLPGIRIPGSEGT